MSSTESYIGLALELLVYPDIGSYTKSACILAPLLIRFTITIPSKWNANVARRGQN